MSLSINVVVHPNVIWLIAAAIALVILLIVSLVFFKYFRLWLQSFLSGAEINFLDLVAMTFRKIPPAIIVQSKIMAVQAGLDDPGITHMALQAHYLAGGNVSAVIEAMVESNRSGKTKLTFRDATAIDLSGRDVLKSVHKGEPFR